MTPFRTKHVFSVLVTFSLLQYTEFTHAVFGFTGKHHVQIVKTEGLTCLFHIYRRLTRLFSAILRCVFSSGQCVCVLFWWWSVCGFTGVCLVQTHFTSTEAAVEPAHPSVCVCVCVICVCVCVCLHVTHLLTTADARGTLHQLPKPGLA